MIRKGKAILAGYAAAGRDPGRYDATADRFHITRPTRHDHLSFGHGVHYCLGAPLVRLESEVAPATLFDRFPGLALAPSPSPGGAGTRPLVPQQRLPDAAGRDWLAEPVIRRPRPCERGRGL
ncbi:cytochrome P450 [Microtetraspora malaysiensis]|uniref:cytochrome P450 n=1 Tax=Microtetraspora malaysiensis TaxID=161358 RepID=UPI003D8B721F